MSTAVHGQHGAVTVLWKTVPSASTIFHYKYLSESIIHNEVVNKVVHPGFQCSVVLPNGHVTAECVCMQLAHSSLWMADCDTLALITEDTKMVLITLGCSILSFSNEVPSLMDAPKHLERCKDIIISTFIEKERPLLPPSAQQHFLLLNGVPQSGKKTFLTHLANELQVLCIVYRATHLYNQVRRNPGRVDWSLFFEKVKCMEPCMIVIQDCHLIFGYDCVVESLSFVQHVEEISNEKRALVIIGTYPSIGLFSLHPSILSSSGATVTFPFASRESRQQMVSMYANENETKESTDNLINTSHGLGIGELKHSLAAVGSSSAKGQLLESWWQMKREQRMSELIHLGIRIVFPKQMTTTSNVRLHGLEDIQQQLQFYVNSLNVAQADSHVLRPCGILLYGPPGTGKTSLAKQLANAIHATFLSIDVSNLVDAHVGESERLLRMLFRQAREMSPTLLFFDEIDCMFNKRQRSVAMPLLRLRSSFILEMDECRTEKNILVIAATNRPWELDQSLLQEGRLAKHFYVGLLNFHARKQILMDHFSLMLADRKKNMNDATLDALVDRIAVATDHYSGADLEGLIRLIVFKTWKRMKKEGLLIKSNFVDHLQDNDIWEALAASHPSVSLKDIRQYEWWKNASY